MTGQIYVEKLIPLHARYAIPLLFIAGNGQTGTVLPPHGSLLSIAILTYHRTG